MAFEIWVFGMRGIVRHHCYHGLDAQNINGDKTVVTKILTRRIGPMRICKKCGIGLRINGNNGKRRFLALAATPVMGRVPGYPCNFSISGEQYTLHACIAK